MLEQIITPKAFNANKELFRSAVGILSWNFKNWCYLMVRVPKSATECCCPAE